MKKIILYTGAVINFLFIILHILFWPMLNWKEELAKLSKDNAGIMQVANIIIIFLLLYFAVMSIIISRMKKLDISAKSIIILIAGFYFLRVVLGYPFFGFSIDEVIIWIVCLLITVGYLSILKQKKLPVTSNKDIIQ